MLLVSPSPSLSSGAGAEHPTRGAADLHLAKHPVQPAVLSPNQAPPRTQGRQLVKSSIRKLAWLANDEERGRVPAGKRRRNGCAVSGVYLLKEDETERAA
ncbi:hypothetical protein PG985_001894 [Apiospora marii]|uniref:Uncharacterized protein n=1 Tax=Apiospora marii TaxID=335849 RepID=A0ABR1RZU2_9PEZI